ncbi:alpha-actinin sarcomeric-related [Anaeramoeba flamelloides]|uniref:Alpha-actinin sarcomeric-related n=1 Tax=Anaeramoeba flamelloides TaxID=1746091 RepID=A0AAV7ZIM8_9EUKA|nr:alpha-actinin sarcomeric-related [Anaeramoeba flamelloides]
MNKKISDICKIKHSYTEKRKEKGKKKNYHYCIAEKDIATDFRDGVLLLSLLEIITDEKINEKIELASHRIQKLQNISTAFQIIESKKIKLTGINTFSILDGKLKPTLALLFAIARLSGESVEGVISKEPKYVHQWAKENLMTFDPESCEYVPLPEEELKKLELTKKRKPKKTTTEENVNENDQFKKKRWSQSTKQELVYLKESGEKKKNINKNKNKNKNKNEKQKEEKEKPKKENVQFVKVSIDEMKEELQNSQQKNISSRTGKISASALKHSQMSGHLAINQGNKIESWPFKYFVLYGKFLYFFRSNHDRDVSGIISLNQAKVKITHKFEGYHVLKILNRNGRIFLRAEEQQDLEKWIQAFENAGVEIIRKTQSSIPRYDFIEG